MDIQHIIDNIDNFITASEILHLLLLEGTQQEEIFEVFKLLIAAKNNISSILKENTIPTDSDEIPTQLIALQTIIDAFASDVKQLTIEPSSNLFKDLDSVLQAYKENLLSWIGAVHTQNNMTNVQSIRKSPVIETWYPMAQAVRDCFGRKESFNMITNNVEHAVNVASKSKRKKEILTYVTVNIEALKKQGVSISHLTPFDGIIHNAVCSLYRAGNKWISYGEIFRVLCGNNPKKRMSPLMKKKIAETVFNLGLTWVKINATAEVEAKTLPVNCGTVDKNEKLKIAGNYGGYLLPINTAEVMAYAFIYKGYDRKVNELPIEDMTLTLVRHSYPRELIKALKQSGFTVDEKYPGIFRVDGRISIKIQIVVSSRLPTGEYEGLQLLGRVHINDIKS